MLADQWKEYVYCQAIPANVLVVKGKKRTSGRSGNIKGSYKEPEDPDGTYAGTKELADGTWYPAENAAANLDEKEHLGKDYQCDCGSDVVQTILGILQWFQ